VIRDRVVKKLGDLAFSLGPIAEGTQWHLFGSVERNEPRAADIDLLILCKDDDQADDLRRSIDSDGLELPLHLALMTFDEAAAIKATTVQQTSLIFHIKRCNKLL
jgi:hypothetical protein